MSDWVNALAVAVSTGGDDELVVAGCGDGGIYVLAWGGSGGRKENSAGNIVGGGLVVRT